MTKDQIRIGKAISKVCRLFKIDRDYFFSARQPKASRARRILFAMLEQEGLRRQEIADKVGFSVSCVHKCLAKFGTD